MKKFVCLLMTMTLVTCLLAGCGSEKKETKAETKAETTVETTAETAGESKAAEDHSDLKLTIYSAVFDDETHAICERFQEETGIKTDCVVLGGGEILARVQAEKDNPTASVWFGGPADPFITAKNEGLLLQYESPNAASIDAKYKDADNYWTGIYIGYVGFVSNNDRLAELNIEAPQSWEDLLKEELKGEIMLASPAASSTGYVILASVLQLMGEEEGFEFMQKLNDNVL